MNNYYAYIIHDSTEVPVYVGAGSGRRTGCKKGRNAKIDALIALGGTLPAVKVREGLTQSEAFDLEKALIAFHGRQCDGGTLLQDALGGPGCPGVEKTPATKARIAAACRIAQLGKTHSAETKAKIGAANSVALRGYRQSAEHKAKVAEAVRNRSPEVRARIGAVQRGKKLSPESITKRTEALRGKPLSAERVAKREATKRANRLAKLAPPAFAIAAE